MAESCNDSYCLANFSSYVINMIFPAEVIINQDSQIFYIIFTVKSN